MPMPSAIENATVPTEELRRYEELQRMALDCGRHGETDDLSRMIDAGMPVELRDEKGNSLLMLAAYNQNPDTTRMLLKRGANPDARNDRGQTPLGGVAFKGYVDLIELLLEHGADINADNGGGKTPMLFAAMFGRFKALRFLKRRGGKFWTSQSA